MKKVCLALCGLSLWFSASSQFSVNKSSVPLTDQQGIDYIIIINGIDAGTELAYTGSYTTINWYEYSNSNRFISNQREINPDNATGYRLEVDGENIHIWIFDYQQYLPNFTSLEPDPDNELPCEKTVFKANPNAIPPMEYTLPDNSRRSLSREFTLTYNSKKYDEGAKDWLVEEKKKTVVFSNSAISLEDEGGEEYLPLDPTTDFVLSGDQYANLLGIEPIEFTASPDPIFLVKSRLTALVTVRDATNEVSRPSEAEPTPPVKASAPIEMSFESRSSDRNNSLYDWKVYKGEELLLTRTDENLNYTFETFGTYWVKLVVNNGYCSVSDSVEVSVAESFLGVPNVFTPNGDDKNDEFRVAFRSLESFHCWVYNNWGRLVYEWNDPARGWDGRMNGKNAPTGTYFYIIKAKGTDGVIHDTKGDISIIR